MTITTTAMTPSLTTARRLDPRSAASTGARSSSGVASPAAAGVASRAVVRIASQLLLIAGLMAGGSFLGGALTPAAAQEGIQPGDVPEPAALETLEGEAVELASFVGEKPVLVEFWATWCAVCRALEPRVTAAHQRFGDRVEFLVVAVGVGQDPAGIARHLRRHPQAGTVLWDARGAAVRAFDAPGTGVVFILDRAGSVAYAGTGPDQDLEAALEAVLADDA
jgi:thiol-disulfide isomerase/thioredoxin